ncbi:hypothetical protein CORC01_01696 [Colletotrichum orchidophilum]|uniref:Uncharacterized protein n=1 Tax=Colletotrichum orchidophilum TaxID=1209926 RepID=A0A1G4BNP5_9PEZI|nr:uncharacterized protein CORC01_01696 [Colletotrichum orchidophilum]OHF02938.1 hypothetical protein CORC01_01696 [Colletotrichum orchidophilum]
MLMHSLHVARLLISSHVSHPASLASPRLASLTIPICLIGQELWNNLKGEFKHSSLFHAAKRHLNGSRFCAVVKEETITRKGNKTTLVLVPPSRLQGPHFPGATRSSCFHVETTSWCSHQM